LPPIDHHDIEYEKFNKNFLEEHSDVASLSEHQVNELRHKLGIKVRSGTVLVQCFNLQFVFKNYVFIFIYM